MSPDSPTAPDPSTPVIVGAARVTQDPDANDDPTDNDDGITLMARALQAAIEDSDAPNLAGEIDLIAAVAGLWHHTDPGRTVAEELGLTPGSTLLTTFGGQTPVALLAELAERVTAGDNKVAVLLGGEATGTRHRLRKEGIAYPDRDEPPPAPRWGEELDMGDEVARRRGAEQPRNSYAIMDSALRVRRGESIDEARSRAATTWARFAAVAADNPHATDRSRPTAEQIREPSPDNRMVSWPYTKAMCANNIVDHAAAAIVCRQEVADRLGVPADRRVYPHVTVVAQDTARLLERDELSEVPGLQAAGEAILARIGGVEALSHLDLYGCFPSIVAITAEVLGVDPGRQLTQTGGLGFAGAALNNAAGESLAAMVETLRADPGTLGLVQGNGGHASKHALMVLSTAVPNDPHRVFDCGVASGTHVLAPPDAAGEVTIDGVTVAFDREGPEQAIVACRFDDGSRSWANSNDPAVMDAFMTEEWVGRRAHVDGATIRL